MYFLISNIPYRINKETKNRKETKEEVKGILKKNESLKSSIGITTDDFISGCELLFDVSFESISNTIFNM